MKLPRLPIRVPVPRRRGRAVETPRDVVLLLSASGMGEALAKARRRKTVSMRWGTAVVAGERAIEIKLPPSAPDDVIASTLSVLLFARSVPRPAVLVAQVRVGEALRHTVPDKPVHPVLEPLWLCASGLGFDDIGVHICIDGARVEGAARRFPKVASARIVIEPDEVWIAYAVNRAVVKGWKRP